MTELGYNPRYANYARYHGRKPEEQLDQDRIDWPGGSMCGFTLWNRERIRDFQRAHPEAFMAAMRGSGANASLVDQDAYDAWLIQWVDNHLKNSLSPAVDGVAAGLVAIDPDTV